MAEWTVCVHEWAVNDVCSVWDGRHGVYFGSGQQHTCPPTHRGNCRAEALTAACGSCEETSWCYVAVEGDWTVTSILWPMSKHKLNI